MAKAVTVIPATINPLTRLPSFSLQKDGLAVMHEFQQKRMNNLLPMKHKLIITQSSYKQSLNGSL